MAQKLIPSDGVFLDTSYAVAISSATDEMHLQALSLNTELEPGDIRVVTTWAVLLEIGNALSKLRYRPAAFELLSSLRADPAIELAPFSRERGLPDLSDLFFRKVRIDQARGGII
jgi:uncharacterized protein